MIRSIEFDLETKSEANLRFASVGGMRAKADRVKAQRAAVRDALGRFGAIVPPLHVERAAMLARNRIEVKLARIAPALLDDDNLRSALKAVRDEVARWIGVDDRDPIIVWKYDQTKAAPHVYRVRIEVEDLSPGEPRRVVLAEMASAGREAAARVRREVTKATKAHQSVCDPTATGKTPIPGYSGPCSVRDLERPSRRGAVQVYRPEEGARAASSGARARAEAAFAKVKGKPTANDLRDAVEGALQRRANREKLPGSGKVANPDPGDEAPARDLADCETCGAKVPAPCTRIGDERMVHGVHVARARAAGLHVPADDRATVRPARVERHPAHWTDHAIEHVQGVIDRADRALAKIRRVATVPGQARLVARACFMVLPWEQPACGRCEGCGQQRNFDVEAMPRSCCKACGGRGYRARRMAPEPRLCDVAVDREAIEVRVPLGHRARWGERVTLRRTEKTIPAHGVCWVYEAAATPWKGQ